MSKTLHIVVGPTGIGKTDKAIEMAKSFNCPIISADSRQLFNELNIGVAKPSEEQLQEVTHYFINHISIHQKYSAGDYAFQARNKINALFSNHQHLIVCGGTGFYIKALMEGLDQLPEENTELRASLQKELEDNGIDFLKDKLNSISQDRFAKTDVENPQRLIRAIEIELNKGLEGEKLPEFEYSFETKYHYMSMDRELLYDRINKRVDKMIEMGLENEVKNLADYKHYNSLNTVGYREWWPYFEGETKLDFVIDKIKQHSRNYAKRQITWFNHQIKK